MLTSEIRADISVRRPFVDGTTLSWPEGRIDLLQHPSLLSRLYLTAGAWFLLVAEAHARDPHQTDIETIFCSTDEYRDHFARSTNRRGEHFIVEHIFERDRCEWQFCASAQGTCPVYFNCQGSKVNLGWDLADFIDRVRPSKLDRRFIIQQIAMQSIYTSRTAFESIRLLTERARLRWQDGHFQFSYPSDSGLSRKNELNSAVDVVDAFDEVLRDALAVRRLDLEATIAELSGGVDSACVFTAYRRFVRSSCDSAGIILPGTLGRDQAERRQLILGRSRGVDHSCAIESCMPSFFLTNDIRPARYMPYEYYHRAFSVIWDSAASARKRVILGGYGGDELFLSRDKAGSALVEREPDPTASAQNLLSSEARRELSELFHERAPAGILADSTLLANLSHSAQLVQKGLWPVNVLADPLVIAFCQNLPDDCRKEKFVAIKYLETFYGMPFYKVRDYGENFVEVARKALRSEWPKALCVVKDGILASENLIDTAVVEAQFRAFIAGDKHEPFAQLANLASIEHFLRLNL